MSEWNDASLKDLQSLDQECDNNSWQDISTAPKDGTVVLLGNSEGTWVGHYVERFVSGYRPENQWLTLMLNHRHIRNHASTRPTHWMPLPEAPKDE